MVTVALRASTLPEISVALHLYFPASLLEKLFMKYRRAFPVICPSSIWMPFILKVILGTGLEEIINTFKKFTNL